MRTFVRDNFAILIGLALPIVVAAFFLLANYWGRVSLEPPAHDALLRTYSGGGATRAMRIEIDVAGERLRVRAFKTDYDGRAITYAAAQPRLLLWSHDTETVRELSFEVPADFVDGSELRIPELEGRRLSTAVRSPDGYEIGTTGYRNGLFGLFFDRSTPRLVLEKDGAKRALPLPSTLPYWDVQFVAWVIE
jgi:hypothetical protein